MLNAFEKITCKCGKTHDLLFLAQQNLICLKCGAIVCPDCGKHLKPDHCPRQT